ncbi:F-box only protein 32-like isoform X2 [Halichondria panicea]|uniref:F-box only protein 32-like isoform X2 n=1 Tax=Halichondria panicea TaxID=6063 RepID=UPI00312B4812
MALFRDWRSPGEKWIRTDFGWRRLAEIKNSLNQQLRRQFSTSSGSSSKASSTNSSKKVSRATSPSQESKQRPKVQVIWSEGAAKPSHYSKETELIDKQVKRLNLLLDQRCVSARSSSKESSHYSTISDAVNKLNFEQALNNDGCFPFICQVVALIFKTPQPTLSGSMQNVLLRLMDRAKDICISSKKYSGLVFKMMESAISSFEKLRQNQFSSFGVRNVDSKIKSVLKMKRQLQSSLNEDNRQNILQLELDDLPVDCIQHIATYLTHPKDLLNLGATNMRFHEITEDYHIWRRLTLFHYGQVKASTDRKNSFMEQYRDGHLRCEVSAAGWCKVCNFVFWKSYGHPCLAVNEETKIRGPQEQYLTPEQFFQLFVF